MPSLVIRVSAAVDNSVDVAYEPIVKAAERAAKRAQEALNRGMSAAVTDQVRGAQNIAKAYGLIEAAAKRAGGVVKGGLGGRAGGGGGVSSQVADTERAARRAAAATEKSERDGVRAAERAEREKARIRERHEAQNHAIRMRHFREQQREEERIARQRAREERQAERKRAGYDSLTTEQKFQRLERMAGIGAGRKAKVHESTDALLSKIREHESAFGNARDRFSVRDWESEGAMRRAKSKQNRAASLASIGAIGGGVVGVVGSAAAFAGRMALDVARDIGVETDIGQHIASASSLRKQARDLSNSAYMPGKEGAAGMRQDPAALQAEARGVAKQSGFSAISAMTALQKFTAKTGDLESGRAILADMAKFSRATGAELDDMVDAAGDISNALGDAADKPRLMKDVMRAFIAQGKEGAVEIKDLAVQMAKLGGASSLISGDRSHSIATMGALTQMTRAKGGAVSATQAATSLGSFMATFSKQARVNAMENAGIKLREKDGLLRDPRSLIIDILKATGGDANKIGKMVADQGAQRVLRGWTATYNQAGGGDAGIKAVNQEFDILMKSVTQMAEIEDSYRAAMSEGEVKVQLVNNSLEEMAGKLNKDLGPSIARLVPDIERAAKAFANAIGYLTGADEKEGAKSAGEAERRILNMTTKVSRGEKLTPAEAEQFAKDRSTIAGRLSENSKTIAEDRKFVRSMDEFHANRKATESHAITGGLNKWYNGVEAGIQDFVGLTDKEAAARGRVSEMDRMSDTLRQADSTVGRGVDADAFGEAVVRKLVAQKLQVEVVNQPNGPGPSVDNGARTEQRTGR